MDRVIKTRKNCAYEDLENLLLALGFTLRKKGGSHRTFKRGTFAVSVPARKPVKEVYVDEVLALVERC